MTLGLGRVKIQISSGPALQLKDSQSPPIPIPIRTLHPVIHEKTPTGPRDRGAEMTMTVPMIVTTNPKAQTRRRPNMSPKSPKPTCPTMHPRLAAALRTPPCRAICGTVPLLCAKRSIFRIGTMRLMVKLYTRACVSLCAGRRRDAAGRTGRTGDARRFRTRAASQPRASSRQARRTNGVNGEASRGN